MDRFKNIKVGREPIGKFNGLFFQTYNLTGSDSRQWVVKRKMIKLLHIKISAQLPVHAFQQIKVEAFGHTLGIIISGEDFSGVLHQVKSNQKIIVRFEVGSDELKKINRIRCR